MPTRSDVRRGTLVLAVVLAMGVPNLTGCSRGGCASGGESATAAVEGLLAAAESPERRCKYLYEGQSDRGAAWVATVWRDSGTTDPARLRIVEDRTRQMGSIHTVTVTGPSGRPIDVAVLESEGAYLVDPDVGVSPGE